MTKSIITDLEYNEWITSLSKRYRISQIRASLEVNKELLSFYWQLGKDIFSRQNENKYGSEFIKTLSRDLKTAIPEAHCFSPKNLYYIRRFYMMYSEIFPQVEGKSQLVKLPDIENILYSVPWGHHKLLIDKYFNEPTIALSYLIETTKQGWSRGVLLNMLDTNYHLRQGKGITNFKDRLPAPTGELAQEMTKDPYIFDFTNLATSYRERELKDALIKEITRFLLELGEGFAYVGNEYRLKVGETEQFTDLLFYNLKLRCYVVIEVKTVKFEATHLGQLGLYVTAVNHILKTEQDNPTIGLLVCKTKDNVLARYSLEGYNLPIGISEYQLEKLLPNDFKSTLPTIEEIETKLNNKNITY